MHAFIFAFVFHVLNTRRSRDVCVRRVLGWAKLLCSGIKLNCTDQSASFFLPRIFKFQGDETSTIPIPYRTPPVALTRVIGIPNLPGQYLDS